MKPSPLPVLAAGIALLLGGCASHWHSSAAQDSTKFTLGNTHRFMALDSASDAAVDCTGLQSSMLGDGRLEVVANVKSRASQSVQVEIACEFFDSMGRPLENELAWQKHVIGAGDTEVVRFTATARQAVTFTIQVRSVP